MGASVKWISVGQHTDDVRTAIHFFPYAGSISATYPAELTLTIFGQDFETLQVSMEGARLAQPDGLILDQVFPALFSDYEGYYGIKVEINCEEHSHLDLSSSSCITEFICPTGSVRFPAKQECEDAEAANPSGICKCLDDSMTELIAVNAGTEAVSNGFPSGLVKTGVRHSNMIEPQSVMKYKFSEDYIKSGLEQQSSFGHVCLQTFELLPQSPDIVYFTVDNEAKTSYPCSAAHL